MDGPAATRTDVAVLGGGLAGMATALHLARAGLRVAVVEPQGWPREGVGESLEFSAPRLLHEVGIACADDDGVTHPKSAVRIVENDDEFTVWPPAFFAGPPIWCSRRTYHADRRELDQRLAESAVRAGVQVVAARVTRIDHTGRKITGVALDDGRRLEASWYVDASGHNARLVGRALRLDRDLLGPRRWAVWARVPARSTNDETTLRFLDSRAAELGWLWEIPLNDREVSVGVVLGEGEIRHQRALGRGPREILGHHLRSGSTAVPSCALPPNVSSTSYVPYRHRNPVGPNWILVGDASAMVDPLTSNGVTSALRHAAQASSIVIDAMPRGAIAAADAARYRATAPALVGVLNRAIGSFLYDPAIRRRFGLRAAVNLYAATGVITNSLYAKLRPTTSARALAVSVVLAVTRVWTGVARRGAGLGPGAVREQVAA